MKPVVLLGGGGHAAVLVMAGFGGSDRVKSADAEQLISPPQVQITATTDRQVLPTQTILLNLDIVAGELNLSR